MIGRDDLVGQLRALGVAPGGVLVVHTAFSKVGSVEGGPRGLIDALGAALGPDGTLVMPSMSDDDEQPFDPAASSCAAMGVVADAFWRLPGVRRSDNPHAFAAAGARAREITALHPVDVPHGPTARSDARWRSTGRSFCSASATTRTRPSTSPRSSRASATGCRRTPP